MDIEEEDRESFQEKYNLSLFINLKGTINLNQDNKNKFQKSKKIYMC